MSFERFIGARYLRAKQKQAFISLITYLSIAGVAVGVMALIGSINLDIRSFALNAEAGLLSYDAGVVARLHAIEAARLTESDVVDPVQWARRSTWRRTRDGIARLADSLL